MSEVMQSTDELVKEYTSARHRYAIYSQESDGIDYAIEASNEAFDIEDELEARGVDKDKLRRFWSEYAEAHGLDH